MGQSRNRQGCALPLSGQEYHYLESKESFLLKNITASPWYNANWQKAEKEEDNTSEATGITLYDYDHKVHNSADIKNQMKETTDSPRN